MSESFKDMTVVAYRDLQVRMETIKELKEDETEAYEIVRDRATGEQYLHYAYLHVNVAEGGTKEVFHHLLPLENDEVLAIIFGEKEYRYPEHWNSPFLRSGAEGHMFWFDPVQEEENQKYEELGQAARDKLARFREQGSFDDESIRKLLEEMDQMFKDK